MKISQKQATLTTRQRLWRADKLGDLANYMFSSLIISQFITNSFRPRLTMLGVTLISIAVVYSSFILKVVK